MVSIVHAKIYMYWPCRYQQLGPTRILFQTTVPLINSCYHCLRLIVVSYNVTSTEALHASVDWIWCDASTRHLLQQQSWLRLCVRQKYVCHQVMVWWLLCVTGPTMTPSMVVVFKWNYLSQGVAGNSSCRTWVPFLLDSCPLHGIFFLANIPNIQKPRHNPNMLAKQ